MNTRYAPTTGKLDRVLLAALSIAIVAGGMTSLCHWATYLIALPECEAVASAAPEARPNSSATACTDVVQVASAR